jgi:hypothetical protein
MDPIVKLESIISFLHILDKIKNNSVIENISNKINEIIIEMDILSIKQMDFIFRIIEEILFKCEQLNYGTSTKSLIKPIKTLIIKTYTLKKRNAIFKSSKFICFILKNFHSLFKFLKNNNENDMIINLNESIGNLYLHLYRKDIKNMKMDKFSEEFFELNVAYLKNIDKVQIIKIIL